MATLARIVEEGGILQRLGWPTPAGRHRVHPAGALSRVKCRYDPVAPGCPYYSAGLIEPPPETITNSTRRF